MIQIKTPSPPPTLKKKKKELKKEAYRASSSVIAPNDWTRVACTQLAPPLQAKPQKARGMRQTITLDT